MPTESTCSLCAGTRVLESAETACLIDSAWLAPKYRDVGLDTLTTWLRGSPENLLWAVDGVDAYNIIDTIDVPCSGKELAQVIQQLGTPQVRLFFPVLGTLGGYLTRHKVILPGSPLDEFFDASDVLRLAWVHSDKKSDPFLLYCIADENN
jgi:hypothetical protein